jgi:4-amino-4-deoxy-L-arabinose transferase-like glycosyltransferase
MSHSGLLRGAAHSSAGSTGALRPRSATGLLADDRLLVAAIVGFAALLRFAYGLFPRVVRWDEAGHLLVAANLAAGRGYSELAGTFDAHLPPFLPLASAALLKLGISPEWATATAHIVTGALLCIPVFLLGRAIYGRRAGFFAALLVAVYPALAAWPYLWSTMTESPFLLFVFSGLWAVYRALHSEPPHQTGRLTLWYAAVGFWFGLAYLVRPEGLTYFAVLGLFMAAAHLIRRDLFRPVVFGRLALAVVVCLATISPYVLYLHSITGRWLLSGKVGLILDIAPAYLADDQAAHDRAVSRLDSRGEEIMWLSTDRYEGSLSANIAADPRGFLRDTAENIRRTFDALFTEDLFTPLIVALAALGLFAQPWTRQRWAHEALLIAALVPLASFWLFFVISRFLAGALPIGLIWAGVGLSHLVGWLRGTARAVQPHLSPAGLRFVGALPPATAAALLIATALPALAAGTAIMPWANVEAGHWLAANSSPDAVLMTRHSEVGLYADRRLIAAPNATWPQLVEYGRKRGADYLFVGLPELRRLRPQYAALADPATAPPEVAHVATFGQGNQAALLYRFVQ